VDAATPDHDRRIEAVNKVLDEIGLAEIPQLMVFNQVDRLSEGIGEAIAKRYGGVAISALREDGLGELLGRAEEILWGPEAPEFDTRFLESSSTEGG